MLTKSLTYYPEHETELHFTHEHVGRPEVSSQHVFRLLGVRQMFVFAMIEVVTRRYRINCWLVYPEGGSSEQYEEADVREGV